MIIGNFNDIQGAFEDAVVCRELIGEKYRSGDISEKILAIELLAPTLLLFVECCKKRGCNKCAEKQLVQGQEIVQRILHDNKLAPFIRGKARDILKKIVDELCFLYRETGQAYELSLLKSNYAKNYFHLYSINGSQS
ncbi:MAG: hypothetical protein HYV97_18185 [Bdellovibrio sp.]|nr:hypothetical protein [Bdellovibrio sp.]